jgi:hypothetical protein
MGRDGFLILKKYEGAQARFKNPLSQLDALIGWEAFLPILDRERIGERAQRV